MVAKKKSAADKKNSAKPKVRKETLKDLQVKGKADKIRGGNRGACNLSIR